MSIVLGGCQVPRQTRSFTLRTDVDRGTDGAMKASANNGLHTTKGLSTNACCGAGQRTECISRQDAPLLWRRSVL